LTNLEFGFEKTFVLFGSVVGTIGIVVGVLVLGLALFIGVLPWVVQPFIRLVLFFRYDLKRIGVENVPRTGPVLLASNHVTWFDGFFLAATLPRRGTAVVNAGVFSMPVLGFLATRCGLIPVPYKGPKAQRAAIETCRKALEAGKALAIFPESQLTRNGMTGPFFRGLEVILAKRDDIPVVPIYLDNGWGSIMSHSEGKFLWKRPIGWRRTIIVAFGSPVEPPITAFKVRQAVMIEGVTARSALPSPPARPSPIDPNLPHFDHPTLGPLTGSAADINEPEFAVHQVGQKPGSVGIPLPGIAIRAIDDAGQPLLADAEGRLQALVPGQSGWVDLNHRGKLDRDGFVFFTDPESTNPTGS
jgi:1-acyl-sn-glycerol-3-phosphate acyltransferase